MQHEADFSRQQFYLDVFQIITRSSYKARSCNKCPGSCGSATVDPCSKRRETRVKLANTRVSSSCRVGIHTCG